MPMPNALVKLVDIPELDCNVANKKGEVSRIEVFSFLSFFPSHISGVSLLCQELGLSIFHSFSYCLSRSANVISSIAI